MEFTRSWAICPKQYLEMSGGIGKEAKNRWVFPRREIVYNNII